MRLSELILLQCHACSVNATFLGGGAPAGNRNGFSLRGYKLI